MVELSDTQFEGYACAKLENEHLALWITRTCGPRLIGLSVYGGENMLALLPDLKYEYPGQEDYYFHGGHRLWYAPEQPDTTYIADSHPVEIEEIENGIKLVQPIDQPTGVQKSFKITLADSEARVELDHILTNQGESTLGLAPWAITQIRPGGVGIFPQQTSLGDVHGFLPNRHIVLWPYTKINSPHIHWRDEVIFIEATMTGGALKIGFPNPDGWLAYAFGNVLFVKRANYDPDAKYLDRRASSQSYCCKAFIELETLGPYTSLERGENVLHQEIWEFYCAGDWPEEVATLYRRFG
ncbi:MAG: hypothetical protein PVF74_12465 [Anaerolineales bacterium]|jgi:hypothetical protein